MILDAAGVTIKITITQRSLTLAFTLCAGTLHGSQWRTSPQTLRSSRRVCERAVNDFSRHPVTCAEQLTWTERATGSRFISQPRRVSLWPGNKPAWSYQSHSWGLHLLKPRATQGSPPKYHMAPFFNDNRDRNSPPDYRLADWANGCQYSYWINVGVDSSSINSRLIAMTVTNWRGNSVVNMLNKQNHQSKTKLRYAVSWSTVHKLLPSLSPHF